MDQTVEQKRALAIATARMRAEQAGADPWQDEKRAAGLGVRHMGPVAAGMSMGAAMGAPIGGVGAIPGALAGGGAMALVQMIDKLGGTDYINKAMDALGMPRAQSDAEKIAAGGMDAVANLAGMGGALATGAKAFGGVPGAVMKESAEALAASPVSAAASAAGAGMAGEAAEQGGAGPNEKLAAEVAGSLVAPAAIGGAAAIGRGVRRVAGDVGHAVGAAFGRQKSVERLTGDAVQSLVKDDPEQIRLALQNATTHIRAGGREATPTVAEALAERNLQIPDKQIGGGLIKLQELISGRRGVEDVLPSKVKLNADILEEYLKTLGQETSVLRERVFKAAREGTPGLQSRSTPPVIGVDPQYVNRVIKFTMADRAVEGHSLARSILRAVEKDLNQVSRNSQGRIDVEVMQGIRDSASRHYKRLLKENVTSADAVSMKALKRVKDSIDDAIEQSGAVGWKQYIKAFERGMKPVDAHMERLRAAAGISKGVQGTAPEALVEETLPQIPTLLHRPTMVVNFALRLIGKDASDQVTRELANRLADPKGFLQIMSRGAEMPVRKRADKILAQAGLLSQLISNHERNQEPTPDQ